MIHQEERYTVITGSSSGIGYETAKAFAARGKNLIIAARRRNNLAALKNEIQKQHPSLDISYDYDKFFSAYHTSRQMAAFLLDLYDSDKVVGMVDRETFLFQLSNPLLPYAGRSGHNQKAGTEPASG